MSLNKPPWKKRREIPDPQVRDAADQYDNARQLLQQQPPGSGVLLPLLNTAAIAIELFLKSLSSELIHVPVANFNGLSIVHARPELKHHKLVELFDNIPGDIRSQMETSFANDTSAQAGTTLRDMLATYESLFAASRYPFEPDFDLKKYSLNPLMELSMFLRTFVADLKPTDRIEWS
jgi:hypothetical protein